MVATNFPLTTKEYVDIVLGNCKCNSDIRKMLEKAGRDLVDFCEENGTLITRISTTYENGYPEPAYYLSHDTEYYTIEGIRESLLETRR